jgi:hypothetical protein
MAHTQTERGRETYRHTRWPTRRHSERETHRHTRWPRAVMYMAPPLRPGTHSHSMYVCVSVCMSVFDCACDCVPAHTHSYTHSHSMYVCVSVCVFVQVADREDPIGDASRDTLRRHIVDLMLQAPLRVQRQVGEAVTLIADHDFPQQWDYLLQARAHTK